MGSISDKLIYLNTTKQEMKTALNQFGSQITGNDTFRSYVSKIEDVYNNWTKVSDEDTSITLNNTKKGKISLDLKGNTSQNGTPTPTSPQPIHTVSGDNSIEVCGRNLINPNALIHNSRAWSNGVIGDAGRYYRTDYIFVKPNTSYYVTHTFGLGRGYAIWCYDENKNVLGNINPNTNVSYDESGVVTTVANTKYVIINFWEDTLANNTPMLVESNEAIDYIPYESATYPVNLGTMELCKISTYQDKIDKSSGKNLLDLNRTLGQPSNTSFANTTKRTFDLSTFVAGLSANNYYYSSNTTYELISDGIKVTANNTGYGVGFPFKLNKNTQYTFSATSDTTLSGALKYAFYEEDGTFINAGQSSQTNNYVSFTTPNNAYYTVLLFSNTVDTPTKFTNIQLEKGSTTTPEYEPYGTGWYLKKEIGKVVLNGSESWEDRPNYNNCDRFVIPIGVPLQKTGVFNGYSNYFRVSVTSSLEDTYPYIRPNNGQVLVNYSAKGTTTLADFKTWLGTHNTSLYYVLATPTYDKITDTTLISQLETLKRAYSYDDTTNITQTNDDLPFIINASALMKGSV